MQVIPMRNTGKFSVLKFQKLSSDVKRIPLKDLDALLQLSTEVHIRKHTPITYTILDAIQTDFKTKQQTNLLTATSKIGFIKFRSKTHNTESPVPYIIFA